MGWTEINNKMINKDNINDQTRHQLVDSRRYSSSTFKMAFVIICITTGFLVTSFDMRSVPGLNESGKLKLVDILYKVKETHTASTSTGTGTGGYGYG